MTPTDRQPRETPEAEHLAEQERLLAELTEQLTSKEAEFAETGSAFAGFRAEYLRRFAPLYAELDRIEADIARRLAQSTKTPSSKAKATEARAKAEESQRLLDDPAAEPIDDEAADRAAPSQELKALYREAAKLIHPDLATDEAEKERRNALMAALNAAYAASDAEAIQRIVDGERARPEAITGEDIGANIMRAIRRIAQVRRRFGELDRLMVALKSDPMFELFEKDRADWQAGLDPLAQDEASLREQIASAHARLAALELAAARHGKPAEG